jgi:hypothetical protein
MAQFCRILDLPAELRYNIYQQAFLLPATLHVSLTGTKSTNFSETVELVTGRIAKSSAVETWSSQTFDFRQISFEHIVESPDSLVVEPFSLSGFRVNRQIHTELQHLFYTRCTWYFNSLDSLVRGLVFLPDHVRIKIRHLAFTMMAIDLQTRPYDFPVAKFRSRTRIWCLPVIAGLLQTTMHLQSLSIRHSKMGMFLHGVVEGHARHLSEGHKAACAVAAFVWPGVTTSFFYSNADMTDDLVRCARKICGVQNVEWRSRGQDRYCTPLAELVIRHAREPAAESHRHGAYAADPTSFEPGGAMPSSD